MEKIKKTILEFVNPLYGSGNGYGYGSSYGSGNGRGCGDGRGGGYGRGYGSGDGRGSGDGDGRGSGYGDGDGDGRGSGYGDGVAYFNGEKVYYIDGIATILLSVFGAIAKGKILNDDLTLTPCYIARNGSTYAHGETVEEANTALTDKMFEQLDGDEKIRIFIEEFPDLDTVYSAKTFYNWHHKLTGSCEMGRKQFLSSHGYNLETDSVTVREFLNVTESAYGGDIIKKLKAKYEEKTE